METKTANIPLEAIEGSTLVAATGHDAETGVMHIQFQDGSVHAYAGVSAEVHARLRSGGDLGSVGKTFHREIKGTFPSTPLAESEA
jgi:hypothetical protein